MFNREKLKIIELEKYTQRRTTIETRTTGLQGHVCYQNGDRREFVTRAAVRMELEGTGMRTGHRALQMGSESGMA